MYPGASVVPAFASSPREFEAFAVASPQAESLLAGMRFLARGCSWQEAEYVAAADLPSAERFAASQAAIVYLAEPQA